jgi:transcriptional regulator with XRE-family HTH domain
LPATGSPTVRRRELGAALRALRSEHGLTVEQVAQQLLCSPSKVSRLETGQRGASARDIRDLCDLYGVDAALRQQLHELAAEGKQQGWWQSRMLPYSDYVGFEAEAVTISDFGFGLVPGLLQTADYARAVLQSVQPALDEDVVEQRVAGRIERQRRLLTGADPPDFKAVIDETVLHRTPRSRSVMKQQLERLLEVSELPHVSIFVLPFDAGLLPSGINKFIILGLQQPSVPDLVFMEGLTGDLYLDRPEEVQAYRSAFSSMLQMAASAERTRDIIASAAMTYRD